MTGLAKIIYWTKQATPKCTYSERNSSNQPSSHLSLANSYCTRACTLYKGTATFISVDWVLIFSYWEPIPYLNLSSKRTLLHSALCDRSLPCSGFVGVFSVELSFPSDTVRSITSVSFRVSYKANSYNICKRHSLQSSRKALETNP